MSNSKNNSIVAWKTVSEPDRIPYLKLIILSFVVGLMLEAGRLFGAPIASVTNLSDWSKKAILIYTLLSFVVGWLAFRFNWASRARNALTVAKSFYEDYGKRFTICIATSVVLTVVLDVLITLLSGFSEPLPLGLFLFSLFFTASLVVSFRKFIAVKTEWFFLACILSLGMGVVALSPIETSYSYDDQIHYGNATALSYLDNREFSESDLPILEPGIRDGVSLPSMELEVSKLLESWEDFQEGAYSPLTVYNVSPLYRNSLTSYSSFGYVPSATGLYLGRLLHLPYAFIFDLGRLFNLLFFSLIVFMGMRKLKSKKTIACAVMLLPTTVFLACNYSYDPWLTGLLFYALASFVGLLQSGKTINWSDVIKILSASLLGLGPKAIYFPLIFVLLLAPPKKFNGNISVRTYRIVVLTSVLLVLASFALPLLAGGATSDMRGGSDVNATEQIRGILANPIGYFGVLSSFASYYLSVFCAAGYTVGLGYLGFAADLAPLFYAWLIISAFLDDGFEENHSFVGIKWFLVCLAAVLCVVGGILSALYITYTPVGSSTVAGVQGRYLTPLLFFFLAFCLNLKFPRTISRETACLTSFSISAIGLYLVFFVLFVSVWVG